MLLAADQSRSVTLPNTLCCTALLCPEEGAGPSVPRAAVEKPCLQVKVWKKGLS